MQSLSGKLVTVFGLGRFGGGIAVTRWLAGQGAHVLVTDQEPPEKLADSINQLAGLNVEFRLGRQSVEDFTQAELIVASPAVPPHNLFLSAARDAGVAITTEIRLFIERCPAKIFAITGTKGKSTTTAMLGLLLATRRATHIGGNIGGSLLEKLRNITPNDHVVLELSSYMLEHLKVDCWSPHVALVTMLDADHLEWHGSREAYVDAKKNILRFQKPDDWAILNGRDPGAAALATECHGQVVQYGLDESRPFNLQIPGAHNQINAQGAFAAAQIAGVDWAAAQDVLGKFRGLPHRLQLVHSVGGVRWYNDSIATIPQAAIVALESFEPRKVIQIVGGKDKHLHFEQMCSILLRRAKAILCIGATGTMLADTLTRARVGTEPQVYHCGDLQTAVDRARTIAVSGDVILMSPGYPSYDQFSNFEQRGNLFTELARRADNASDPAGPKQPPA